MIQSDENSASDANQSSGSLFTEGGLPDARVFADRATMNVPSFPIVGVGASAGGVDALQRLFKSLPSDRGISYVVVVHLAPAHPSHLADILAKSASIPVVQVLEDVAVEVNTVYVISPDHFLTLSDGYLHVQKIGQPRPLSRAVDRLFVSLAEEIGRASCRER